MTASHSFYNFYQASLIRREDPIPTPIEAAAGAQAVNRSSVAALAFLVWDILITTQDEVDLIWPKPWSVTKCLYFFIRYVPVLVQISILFVGTELSAYFHFTFHDCYIWQVYQGVASMCVILVVDVVLILRVYALYHGHWAIKLSVGVAFLMEFVCMAVGLALTLPGIRYDEICATTAVPRSLLIYGAGSVLFQIILFILTAIRFVAAVRSGWGRVPLVELIMRDGTWAFFVLVAIVVSEAGLFGLKNHAFAGVLYGWLLTTFSFVGYHILINLQTVTVETSLHRRHRPTSGYQFSSVLGSDPESAQSESYELSIPSTTVA